MIEIREYKDEYDYLRTNKNDLMMCNAILYSQLQNKNIHVPLWSSKGNSPIQKYFKKHSNMYSFPFGFVSDMFNYDGIVELKIYKDETVDTLKELFLGYCAFTCQIHSHHFVVSVPMIHPSYLNYLLSEYDKIFLKE